MLPVTGLIQTHPHRDPPLHITGGGAASRHTDENVGTGNLSGSLVDIDGLGHSDLGPMTAIRLPDLGPPAAAGPEI